MPSVKRFFGSPFKLRSPKRNKSRITSCISPSIKPNDSESSMDTTSHRTIPTVATASRSHQFKEESFNGVNFESNHHDQEANDNDDFRSTIMASTSVDTDGGDEMRDDIKNDRSHEHNELMIEDDDFKTTVMPSRSTESNDPSKETRTDDHLDGHSRKKLDYIPTKSKKENSIPNEMEEYNNSFHTRFSSAGNDVSDADNKDHESPINSVVFEKQLETGHQHSCGITEKIGSTSQMSPLPSPSSGGDDRSTISGLTEATNFRGFAERKNNIPPSPANSTNSAVNKKMEDFLKTETEALRQLQLLSHADSGDDGSTVVEESMRGANEAERMVREMEREMELLVQGNHEQHLVIATNNEENGTNKSSTGTASCLDDIASQAIIYRPQQDSPESNEFLTDIRSVIHPSSDTSIDRHCESDTKSRVTSLSHTSLRSPPHSPRRDLFRKRNSLYKLKQKRKKTISKKRLRRCMKYLLRAIFLALLLCSMAFVVNWKLSFSDHDFSNAAKGTMVQIKRHTSINPQTRKEFIAIVTKTTKSTRSYVEARLESCATTLSTNSMVLSFQRISSFLRNEAIYYTPIVAEKTKIHVINGVKATNAFAIRQLDSYVWTSDIKTQILEGLQVTNQYVKDKLEYAFTDRAAREQRIEEEKRLRQLMEAAAAAAAKEASVQQQQLWTQTMFAGACAFVGSVATNYIWSAL